MMPGIFSDSKAPYPWESNPYLLQTRGERVRWERDEQHREVERLEHCREPEFYATKNAFTVVHSGIFFLYAHCPG
jgi:hypothetical protein